jgi:hypothetical protein
MWNYIRHCLLSNHPKRFLFITSNNLATNPRLLKEVQLVSSLGHSADVYQFELGNWSDNLTNELCTSLNNVHYYFLSAKNSPFIQWFISSLAEIILRAVPVNILNDFLLSVSIGKRSLILHRALKKNCFKYDWVIAHNPAAFYPAYHFSKSRNIRLGIDIEDYHPGETNKKRVQRRMEKLMQDILPYAKYCSTAAPMIAEEVVKYIPAMSRPPIVVLNGFPSNQFIPPQSSNSKRLKLVWFSQNIDAGRGLEEVIASVNEIHQFVELHLIGSLNSSFADIYLQKRDSIFIYPPIPQAELYILLSKFDVGLATDLPFNRNRDIAITNKLLVYAQAGLVIAAMRTAAQDQFLSLSGLHYVQMKPNRASVKHVLLNLYDQKQSRGFDKNQQYINSKKYSWEVVSAPLLYEWGL